MNDVRMLTSANEDVAVAFCCKNPVSGISEDDNRELAKVATRYLREELEKNQMPMGCSAKDAKKHINRAVDAAYDRMKNERSMAAAAKPKKGQPPACGFPILAIFTFLSALWSIFKALRYFLYGEK